MKAPATTLALLFCLAARASAVEIAPACSDDQTKTWKAFLSAVEDRFELVSQAQRRDGDPEALNRLCRSAGAPKDFEECGAVVDHSIVARKGLRRQGDSWIFSDGDTRPAMSDDAVPAISEICQFRANRERGRRADAAPPDHKPLDVHGMLDQSRKILADADRAFGTTPAPASRSQEPRPKKHKAEKTFLVDENACGAGDCACWGPLIDQACANGDGGSCVKASSYAPSCVGRDR